MGGQKYVEVTLTDLEMRFAQLTGKARHDESHGKRRDNIGNTVTAEHSLKVHMVGAAGEIAAAKVLGLYWCPSIGTFHKADLGRNIQVRTRSHHGYDLVIRDGDCDKDIFVLVTREPGSRLFRVGGWLRCDYARAVGRYITRTAGREPCWFVDGANLRPISELL